MRVHGRSRGHLQHERDDDLREQQAAEVARHRLARGMFNTTSYCNSGGQGLLTLAGGHSDQPAAALHEGGHAFHALADEYADCIGTGCGSDTKGTGSVVTAYQEINSARQPDDHRRKVGQVDRLQPDRRNRPPVDLVAQPLQRLELSAHGELDDELDVLQRER
jgi:hypothetical protein